MAKLIELNKRKAELEFKKEVYGEECEAEMKEISALPGIIKKAEKAGVELIYPRQDKLEEMGERLKEFSPQQIKDGLAAKSGDAYGLLHERGIIVKENYRNRLEIAKLCVIVSMLNADEKNAVSRAVRTGAVAEAIAISTLKADAVERLATFMRRCGINCTAGEEGLKPSDSAEKKEVCMDMSNKKVWITEDMKDELDENLGKLKDVNSKIQLINAERYIKKFSDEEEKNFEELQNEYLNLLKKQDELLKDFNEEEKLSVKS